MLQVLKISEVFTDVPGPRYIKEGEYSGEEFREKILYPKVLECIQNGEKLVVDLDGTQGYGTSFLEEAFGGLIRENGLKYQVLKDTLVLVSNEEPYLIDDINSYWEDADK